MLSFTEVAKLTAAPIAPLPHRAAAVREGVDYHLPSTKLQSAARCCWSKWGDKSSCGDYPAGGTGGRCSTDWTKTCSGIGDCPATPTPKPPPSPKPPSPSPTPPGPAPPPLPPGQLLDLMIAQLNSSNYKGVFQYQTPTGGWLPSTLYTWEDMIAGVKIMATQGIGNQSLYIGEGHNFKYGLVNLAAFLGESMKETIMYNACDENNWSDPAEATKVGGAPYPSSASCGQGGQSYQDYKCSASDDAIAGGKMACDYDPTMEMRAHTQAEWYGAPPKMFCGPKAKLPKAPKWNYAGPWCPQKGGYGYKTPFPSDVSLDDVYFPYVSKGGSCQDYDPIKSGGWEMCGANGCSNPPAPIFNQTGRTDTEGCCWWGRGVIQTTGTCNFGKLNYYMGARGHAEGRKVLFPEMNFCKNPEAICAPESPPQLKWIAGFFYWLNSVQSYVDKDGWRYMDHLKNWTDAGMKIEDESFINACSGIVNRGCYNPPCGGNVMDGGKERAANFATVLKAMKLV